MPIIPMVLVNGAEGIGTGKHHFEYTSMVAESGPPIGWSTNTPCYNPEDIVTNLRWLMAGEEMVPMLPWW